MTELENVVKGLECCLTASMGEPICPTCTYRYDENGVETGDCEINLLKDAIALLKAQEPVEYVVHCKNADLSNGTEFACGECGGSLLHKKVNYCPWCGRAVKWE